MQTEPTRDVLQSIAGQVDPQIAAAILDHAAPQGMPPRPPVPRGIPGAEGWDAAAIAIRPGPLALVNDSSLSRTWRRAMRGHQKLLSFAEANLPVRRKAPGSDFPSRLASATAPEPDSDKRLVGLFLGILLGAFDTTSLGLASMLYLLAARPDWQECLREKRHSGIYGPSGAGAHVCIGMQLANLEAKLVVHALLIRCRFELASHDDARHTFAPIGCVLGDVRLRLTDIRHA
jgi:cytochrome P450